MKKKLVVFTLKILSGVLAFLLSVFKRDIKFNIANGIFLSSIKVRGDLEVSLKSGYVVKSSIKVNGFRNVIEFDSNVKIINCVFLIKGNNCRITINGGRIIKNTKFELLDSNTSLHIGKDTGFNNNRLVLAGEHNKIQIGGGCIFAENAEIWASDTHSIIDTKSNKRINKERPVIIHDRVWVGNRALIMKGVEIENDVIVAAGSIVTRNIPSNNLVAGVPASIVKENVKWDINRI